MYLSFFLGPQTVSRPSHADRTHLVWKGFRLQGTGHVKVKLALFAVDCRYKLCCDRGRRAAVCHWRLAEQWHCWRGIFLSAASINIKIIKSWSGGSLVMCKDDDAARHVKFSTVWLQAPLSRTNQKVFNAFQFSTFMHLDAASYCKDAATSSSSKAPRKGQQEIASVNSG